MVKNTKDIDKRYNYIKDYIKEAIKDRTSLKHLIERVILAYKLHPERNTYKENALSFYKTYSADTRNDREVCKYMEQACNQIPEAQNDTIFNAVETVVSMTQGGIGQFEYKPADEYLSKDAQLADMQAAFLKYMYEDNHIEELASSIIRKMVMQGQVNAMIKPCDSGFKISLIDAYKMIEDPRASKNNRPRYIGFQEITSWSSVKDDLTIIEKDGEYQAKVINDVDIYLQELQDFGKGDHSGRWDSELTEDVNTFQTMYSQAFLRSSKSINKDDTKVENPVTNPGYKGDDVEVTYIWDLISDIYFVVINRRFIVYMKKNPLQRKIKINIPYKDPLTGELTATQMDYTVKIDSPIVSRGYIQADWETYPISPVFYTLDEFDNLCAKESVLEHNLSIMSPITFLSSNYDAEKISGLAQIAGQIVEGSMNTLQVLNKNYDLSSITAAIQRSETRIKRMMGATDQYELMALLNNRATGAEVSMANGAVSQRMNILISRMEGFYSELMSKLLKMRIIYAKNDETVFTFPYKDGVMALDQADIAGHSLVRVKLASRIKVEQQQQSQNALMVLQTLTPLQQQGINTQRVISALVPIITEGVVDRRTAESFFDDSLKIDPAQLNAAINKVEAQRKQQEGLGPLSRDKTSGLTVDDMNNLSQLTGGVLGDLIKDPNIDTSSLENGQGIDPAAVQQMTQPIQPTTQEPSDYEVAQQSQQIYPEQLPTGADQQTPMPQGLTPEMAGNIANTNQNLGAM